MKTAADGIHAMRYALRLAALIIVLAVAFIPAAATSHAAALTVLTDASPAAPLVITPLDAAEPLVVSLVNSIAVDPPADFITAWQLRLQIVSDAGATGAVNFAAAVEPDAYLFDGTGHLGPSAVASADKLFAFDVNSPATGGVQ